MPISYSAGKIYVHVGQNICYAFTNPLGKAFHVEKCKIKLFLFNRNTQRSNPNKKQRTHVKKKTQQMRIMQFLLIFITVIPLSSYELSCT